MSSTLGSTNGATGGGTGGAKNFYSRQDYNGSRTITGSGFYSGKGTSNPNGQITLQRISLLSAS